MSAFSQSADLNALLRATSRSFYLTLRVLPRAIRPQIGLAYLLARATDTIADTKIVPVEKRLEALRALRGRILGETSGPLDLEEFVGEKVATQAPTEDAERQLLERINDALAAMKQFSAADQRHIRDVLAVITRGQELDVARFGQASAEHIVSLKTVAELDDYTFRVAGCVGGFWTKICRARLFPDVPLDETQLLTDAVRFGKGLQLVNILRDLPRDLREGRCYLPDEDLVAAGLKSADLLWAENMPRLRPVYDAWLARADAHLAAGWNYTNALPRNQRRLRLACAWPILIGVRTLALLRTGNPLDPAQRIKVGRAEVRGLVICSLFALPFGGAWRGQFERAQH
ncbi:MAG TPA: phytoene/squalene synthase family protein [Verrucomicrobiae bacterium]|jgi:farnesyl-diphosphate farnesyltransferase